MMADRQAFIDKAVRCNTTQELFGPEPTIVYYGVQVPEAEVQLAVDALCHKYIVTEQGQVVWHDGWSPAIKCVCCQRKVGWNFFLLGPESLEYKDLHGTWCEMCLSKAYGSYYGCSARLNTQDRARGHPVDLRTGDIGLRSCLFQRVFNARRRDREAEHGERMMKPNPRNACSGRFHDWLEVMLTPDCNATCSWCVEKGGFRPKKRAAWRELASRINKSGNKNVILLGGEPTLYKDLAVLVGALVEARHHVYITTNGSMLTTEFVVNNLCGIAGVNISIHDYDLRRNQEITGIALDETIMRQAITAIGQIAEEGGGRVRFNCNMIRGHIDTEVKAHQYVAFAQRLGATSVRFAELKDEETLFVNIARLFNYKYGLNDDPFTCGCNQDAEMDGMPVNFRQMCGIQTTLRPAPDKPEQKGSPVLYYDGYLYNGWQRAHPERTCTMSTTKQLLLEQLERREISVQQAIEGIDSLDKHETDPMASTVAKLNVSMGLPACAPDRWPGGGCMY